MLHYNQVLSCSMSATVEDVGRNYGNHSSNNRCMTCYFQSAKEISGKDERKLET